MFHDISSDYYQLPVTNITSMKFGRDKYAHLINLVNEKRLIRNAVEPLEVSVNESKEMDKGIFNK